MFPSTSLLSEFECPLYQRGRCNRPFCKYQHGDHSDNGNVSPIITRGVERHHETSCETLSTQEDNGACLLELEKIKKQIESVKCEVEQQQRKLSHYKTRKNDQYRMCTSVSKSKNKIAANDSSAKKYVLEKSRPLTDLEYDPCSNFSSGLLSSTLSDCSGKPCKDKEISLEQCKTKDNQSKNQETKISHHSDDSDDGTLVIDVPCLEEDPQGINGVAQTVSTETKPTESLSKETHEAKQCIALSSGLSTHKNLQTNEQCVKELLKSPAEISEDAKTRNGTAMHCFDRSRESASSIWQESDADLPATRERTEMNHVNSRSHHEESEKSPNIENVLDDLSACLDDLRNQSETIGCTSDLELVPKMIGNGFDVTNQNEHLGFCSLQQEIQVQIDSLERELRRPNKIPHFPLHPTAPQSHIQHTVVPKESLLLSDHQTTTSVFAPTKNTRSSGQDVDCFTGSYWTSVRNVKNETCTSKLPAPSFMTAQHLDGGQSTVQSMRCQDALMTASNLNRFQMLKKPISEPSVGYVHQAPAVLHTPASTTVPRIREKEETFEIVPSSEEEELNYSDLDLSESDPMEECYKIFMEANKDGDSGIQDASPVQAGKPAEADLKLKMDNGQKKRMAHTPRFEAATTKPKPQVLIPLRGETSLMTSAPVRRPQPPQQQQFVHRQPSVVTTAIRSIQGPGPSSGHISKYAQFTSHPSLPQNACVNIIPVGTTVQLPPSMHFILPQGHYMPVTVPMPVTVLSPPVVMPRAVHLTPAKSVPVKRKAKEKSEVGVKVPHNIRQRYVNLFVEEFLKTSATVPEAFEKALVEEKSVYERSINRLKYLSVAVNALKRLRSQNSLPSKGGTENVAKESKGNIALKACALHGAGDCALHESLKEHILSDDTLRKNSYPSQHPGRPGYAMQYGERKKTMADALKRICCRCGSTFSVSQTGKHTRTEECTYHYGKVVENRVPGGVESRYSCCEATAGTSGCQVFKLHVHDACSLSGFVSTMPASSSGRCCPGVYAIDCEMCYTTQGLELARVTVVNSSLQVIYDTFVQPESEVIDYNTRFSGVTEKDVRATSVHLTDVQNTLLKFITSDTILIGHELENDLCAIKLLHGVVVDTSVVFPHRLGPPHKLELHHLTADYLRRIIQESVDGHDTGENATACMELMLWRVKEDAKVKRW
ncbi:RNA exonuclease 1 homolog [Sardina pilchardus]|uniref:RNA exonuclease 1 homolog n=1 Tax=Sardina pilchardus TaxID=27697 RepID=UPI002E1106AD